DADRRLRRAGREGGRGRRPPRARADAHGRLARGSGPGGTARRQSRPRPSRGAARARERGAPRSPEGTLVMRIHLRLLILALLAPALCATSPAFGEDEHPGHEKPQAPGVPGTDYRPVITPDGATLPFRVVDGVKVFHLIAEEV